MFRDLSKMQNKIGSSR